LNYHGATKFTKYLGEYLTANYELKDHRREKEEEKLGYDFEGYKKFSQYFADKRVIYVIYCDMGVNSMIAGNNLAAMGYRVKSLVGGISGYKGKELATSDN